MKNIMITKTDFVNFVRCHKMLWMKKFKPSQKKQSKEYENLNIVEGNKVGELALDFPKYARGKLIKTLDIKKSLAETEALLKENTKTLYEPAFKYVTEQGLQLFLRADIMKEYKAGWHLVEVKSSTRTQEIHFWDIAFQVYVLDKLGKKPKKSFLMKPDKEFKRDKEVEAKDYFVTVDVTRKIEQEYLPKVEVILERLYKSLQNKAEPSKVLGSHCKSPWQCPYYEYCHKNINVDSVEKLSRLTRKKRQVFRKTKVKYLHEIPNKMGELMSEYSKKSSSSEFLSPKQKIQVHVALNEKPYVDIKGLEKFLSQVQYPIYHLDFEAYNKAIPNYQGMKPHQFVTFQASLHKEFIDERLEHFEFLQEDNKDPRLKMINFLLKNIGQRGTITVYNKSFEETRIKELANDFPMYKKPLMKLIDRMLDLEIPFRKFYYHHAFEGRSSIKYVLPVMAQDLSYDRLNIQNGAEAQAIYRKLIDGGYHTQSGRKGSEFNKVKNDLLEYCKLDTYAMVVLLRELRNVLKTAKA